MDFASFDRLPIGVIILDHTLRVVHWNTCIEDWSGVQRNDIVGAVISERFPRFLEANYQHRLQQVFHRGFSAFFSSQLHRHIIPCSLPNGSTRVQTTTITPLAPEHLPAIAPKRAQKKQQESQASQASPEQPERAPNYALIAIQDITDLTKQAQKYRSMRDRALREAEERGRVEAQVRMLNEQLERRVAERTLQVQQINIELTREMNERELAQQALRRSEQTLSMIFDTVSVGLSVVDKDGRYVRVNRAYLRILGYDSIEALQNKHFTIFYPAHEADEALARLRQLLASSDATEIQGERTLTTPNKGTVDVFFATNKLEDEFGGRFVITALTDITLLKRAENEIRAALYKEQELGELKSHFVSLVSHEFRTPLTIILSSAELLQGSPHLTDEKRKTLFFRIESSIQRMTELLEDVLFIERTGKEGVAFRPVQLDLPQLCHQIIDEAVTAFNANRGLERSVRLSFMGEVEHLKEAYMDEQLIRYILLNLLINAFKYSPNETQPTFDVICTQTHIVFRVEDHGIGIPSEDMPKIFGLFHRGKNAGNIYGTGLGLAIVKRSVDAHGGVIECESTLGKGSTFTVSVPRNTPPATAVILP
jgi:PAS domain S-box-containing protein